MYRKLMIASASIAMLASAAPSMAAPPCKDAKGKFMKCPTAAATKPGVTKDKSGRCHIASGPKKGQFTKC